MIILLDNGHGINTAGKRSPDGRHLEYKWTREFADKLVGEFKQLGYDVRRIVTENYDVSLTERCRRVNSICDKYGAKNVILVSLHNNAAGIGTQWMNARGFSSHVALNASLNSKLLATEITKAVYEKGFTIRKYLPNQYYWSQNLAICRDTKCPAVLTENLFQDNKEDVSILDSIEGKNRLCEAHVNGILRYLKSR